MYLSILYEKYKKRVYLSNLLRLLIFFTRAYQAEDEYLKSRKVVIKIGPSPILLGLTSLQESSSCSTRYPSFHSPLHQISCQILTHPWMEHFAWFWQRSCYIATLQQSHLLIHWPKFSNFHSNSFLAWSAPQARSFIHTQNGTKLQEYMSMVNRVS